MPRPITIHSIDSARLRFVIDQIKQTFAGVVGVITGAYRDAKEAFADITRRLRSLTVFAKDIAEWIRFAWEYRTQIFGALAAFGFSFAA